MEEERGEGGKSMGFYVVFYFGGYCLSLIQYWDDKKEKGGVLLFSSLEGRGRKREKEVKRQKDNRELGCVFLL